MKTQLSAVALVATLSVGCGGSDADATSDAGDRDTGAAVNDTATTDTAVRDYKIDYVAVGAGLTVGKSSLQLRVTAPDGSPATGLASSIALSPLMIMPKMSHGNPVPIDAVKESATVGTYDATLFFTMASVDASGNPAGQWKLGVTIADRPKVDLDVVVNRAASSDTTHAFLRNEGDTIAAMGGAKMRNYAMFRDTLTPDGAGGYRLALFLATVQEGMLVWPPLTAGLKLTDAAGKVQLTVDTLAVEAAVEGSSFAPMTCDERARCTVTLNGLTAGTGAKVLVKLKINGRDYTTDGAAPSGSNAHATFALTPGAT